MSYSLYNTPGEFFGPGYSVSSGNITQRIGTTAVIVGTFVPLGDGSSLTLTGHGLKPGIAVSLSTTGSLPDGLNLGLCYVASIIDANTIRLTNSPSTQYPGLGVSGVGTGTHTLSVLPLFPEITNDLSAPGSGSTAQIVFGFVEGIYKRFTFIESGDKPTKFNITRNGYIDEATGELVYNYSVTCRVTPGSLIAVNS